MAKGELFDFDAAKGMGLVNEVIDAAGLERCAAALGKSSYGAYLRGLLEGRVF